MTMKETRKDDGLGWQISVPMFRNAVILRQLAVAIGIPFGILMLIIAITSGKSVYTLYALGLICALLLLTWLFLMLVYRGRYDAEFVLNGTGALCRTQAKQAKKNRVINSATMALGILSGRFTAAGAGALAQSRQEVFVRWSHARKVRYRPRSCTILIKGGFAEQIALFCTPENYRQVEEFVKSNIKCPEKKSQ